MKFLCCLVAIAISALANATQREGHNCETPCTREFRPVCGSNGEHFKIFNNPCLLRNEHCRDGRNWAQTRMDACQLASLLEEDQNCETPCTREFRPVCGSNGEHFKIFNNPCLLRNEHCRDGRNWAQTRMDACQLASLLEEDQNCETPCTREFRPVCGSDGQHFKIFNNPCLLKNEHCRDGRNWAQTRMDACQPASLLEEDQNCETPCTREFRPVCGSDGQHFKIFNNPCLLKNEHCRDGRNWAQTRMDACQPASNFEDKQNCETACTRELRPVCGTEGKHFKIFANPCILRNEHCKDGLSWIQTRMAECSTSIDYAKTCKVPCTRELRPVCGTDGENFKIFNNPCVMGNQHCKDGHGWFQTRMENCGNEDNEDNCAKFCPALYAPVCGFNGTVYKLFPNNCMMQTANCREHKNWTKSSFEKCSRL